MVYRMVPFAMTLSDA